MATRRSGELSVNRLMPTEKHDELPLRRRQRSWTRAEDYLDTARIARREAARRRKRMVRTEAPEPRSSLGLIPFALLMAALAVLALLIIIAAVPGKHRPAAQPGQQGNPTRTVEMDIRDQR